MKKSVLKDLRKQKKIEAQEIMKRERLQAVCDHKLEKKGKEVSQLKPEGDHFKCRVCGTRIDFDAIDKAELKEATDTVRRALEQIKTISDDMNDEIVEQMAFVIQFNTRIESLYEDVRETLIEKTNPSTKGYNNNFDNNMYGNYCAGGAGPLIIGDYKKDKHKHKNKNHKNNKNKKKKKDKWY